jgi:hypothetical protein
MRPPQHCRPQIRRHENLWLFPARCQPAEEPILIFEVDFVLAAVSKFRALEFLEIFDTAKSD